MKSHRLADRKIAFLGALMLAQCLGWSAANLPSSNEGLPNYFTRVWDRQDGLPDDDVTCVVQTRDAYLWVGTRNGLARFNGDRFTVFNDANTPAMHGRHVSCLFEASNGTLWIGYETGDVMKLQDGRFQAVPTQAEWRRGKVFAIAADTAGNVWAMNQFGDFLRLSDGFVATSPSDSQPRLLSVTRKPLGGFCVQLDNRIFVLDETRLELVPLEGVSTNQYVQGISVSREGGLWVMAGNQMREWRNGQWTNVLGEAPWSWSPVHTVLETREGYLAAATADYGLYLVFPGQGTLHFSRTNGFPSDWVTALCHDREGNLWAGTANGGLAMLRTVNVSNYSPPDQWQNRALLSVIADTDDGLWVGTEGAGLYRFRNGTWTHYNMREGIENHYVWSLSFDARGRVWAGTWGDGVFVQDGDRFRPVAGLEGLSVGALERSTGGRLWLGTSVGLLEYQAGHAEWLAGEPAIYSPDVRAISQTGDGTLWIGLFGGGLACVQAGDLRQFREEEGLSSDFVQCLHADIDDTLWIGTLGGGLNRLKDGRFATIAKSTGLHDDNICWIADDGQGFFWISSKEGIGRVSKAELDACADGDIDSIECLSYGLSDGLPTVECSGGSQPSGCRTSDGRLWFPTAKGLVCVNPGKVTVNWLPPPVVIEGMRVDEKSVSPESGSVPQIAPGRRRIEFTYAGLSFAAPEQVQFKYRLLGLDRDWVDVGSTRVTHFNYLPPGEYTFQVMACNNDGIWNSNAASLAFTMLPFFWQTTWFRVLGLSLLVFGAGTVVWLDARRRMRRKLERLARLRAIERERARIAKDIHDDLGASLTRITLLSQSARSEMDNAPRAAADVDRIYTTARELTRAMDEIVWAVNPQHDTLDSLVIYLGKFAQDYLRAAGVRCHLDLPEQLPQWSLTAEVRHNLFLAFKESLHNVVKHAKTPAAHVRLVLRGDGFDLILEDQGQGFEVDRVDPAPADPDRIGRGNGLVNMERRLQEVGGVCRLQSKPGKGTKVSFCINIMN